MSAVKIKDPAHAVRVLEYLASEKDDWMPYMDWTPADELLYGLFEGAKAVLDEISMTKIQIEEADYTGVSGDIWTRAHNRMVIAIAQAYAPRMAEAGMKVPK